MHDTATPEIYTLSLHDALPILIDPPVQEPPQPVVLLQLDGRRHVAHELRIVGVAEHAGDAHRDRKSTRLNSSHVEISYAVFCLKKKKKVPNNTILHIII